MGDEELRDKVIATYTIVVRWDRELPKMKSQIDTWRGAIALIAFAVLAFGGILCAHIISGK